MKSYLIAALVAATPAFALAQPLPTPTPLAPSKPAYLPQVPAEIAAIRDAAL